MFKIKRGWLMQGSSSAAVGCTDSETCSSADLRAYTTGIVHSSVLCSPLPGMHKPFWCWHQSLWMVQVCCLWDVQGISIDADIFVQLYKAALSHKEPPEKLPGQAGLQEVLGQPANDPLLGISGILDRTSSVYRLAESAYQVRRELRAGLQTEFCCLLSLVQDLMNCPSKMFHSHSATCMSYWYLMSFDEPN